MEKIRPAYSENNTAILFASNDDFAPYMAVMIQSVIDHASPENNYDIVIFHGAISDEKQEKIRSLSREHANISIRFTNVDPLFDSLELYTSISGMRLTREAYYRLAAGEVLGEEYTRVIYLDGDMITLTDIAELNSVDLEGYYVAAPYDISGIGNCHRPGSDRADYRRNDLNLSDLDSYFIDGLMVMNLTMLRKDYPGDALLKMAASRKWKQHDQDVLNVICNHGKAYLLHPKWNVLADFDNNRFLPQPLMDMWLESEQNPLVVHYGGNKKPWSQTVIREEYFWQTAARTPFWGTIVSAILQKVQQYREEEWPVVSEHIETVRKQINDGTAEPSRNGVLAALAKLDSKHQPSANPLVSVIVPAYNEEKRLDKCLTSIISQTYTNLEIIVVDDGSTDGTAAIIDRYAEQDPRIKAVHKPNGGVASARNAGLKMATGEYIGWVDSDDWIASDMFEYLVHGAREYGAPVTVCGHVWVYPERQVNNYYVASDRVVNLKEALKMLIDNRLRNYLYDRLWERWLFDGLEFKEGVVFEDFRVIYRLLLKARWVTLLSRPKYYRNLHQGSIVMTFSVRNRLDALLGHIERYRELDENWPWPDLKPALIQNFNTSLNSFLTAVKRDTKENYQACSQEIGEVIAFLKEHRTEFLRAMNAGSWRTRAFDEMTSGTRAGWLKAYAILKLGEKKNNRGKYVRKIKGKIKKRIRATKQFATRVKNKIVKVKQNPASLIPESREKNRLQEELQEWIRNAPEGESETETKRRFFMAIPKVGGDIGTMQQGNLYLLRWFKHMCEENGIQFWILGGTMLGAVRHRGYIPWDDDIDVGILREELEKCEKVIWKYPDFCLKRYYHSRGPWQTLKITYNDEDSPFWIDLLVYDYAGDRFAGEEEVWRRIQKAREQAKSSLRSANQKMKKEYVDAEVFDEKDTDMVNRAFKQAVNILPAVITKDYIYRSVDSVCGKWQQLFPCERMLPFTDLEFEGDMYPAPKDIEWYLQLQYGDYLTLPNDIGHMHTRFIGEKLENTQAIERILGELREITEQWRNN